MEKLGEKEGAKKVKHLEAEAWEDFLDMAIGQASLWAAKNVEPDKTRLRSCRPSRIFSVHMPVVQDSGAAVLAILPEHPKSGSWGYNRMSTVKGMFMAGDVVGASGHKFSSGSHAEGRIAAKAGIAFILDEPDYKPAIKQTADEIAAELYLPYEIYEKYKTYTTDPEVNPYYIRPKAIQMRLMKLADEYFGGVSTWYMTSRTMLEEGLRQLDMLKEDLQKMAAKDLHELLRCWENTHRVYSLEAHARHILFREESRYPGYYYRGDLNKIDDENWKCFVNSTYDAETNKWELKKVPYVQIYQ